MTKRKKDAPAPEQAAEAKTAPDTKKGDDRPSATERRAEKDAVEIPAQEGAAEPPEGEGAAEPREEEDPAANIADLEGRLLRALAETENVRRRAAKEREDVSKYAIAALARDNQSSFQKEAIRQLGAAPEGFRATGVLKPLLHHADPRIRVAAYRALLGRRGSGIRTYTLGKHPTLPDYNFKLDVIPSAGPGLIHAHATGKRRIAIFGADLACRTPVFYSHPDQAILINALETDQNLTLIRRARFADTVSPPIPVPLSVVDLVRKLGEDPVLDDAGNVRGVGMGYDQTILILHTLCGNSTIPAKFMFDRPSITDLTGPLPPEGRPETDL